MSQASGVLPDRVDVFGDRPADGTHASGTERWVEVHWFDGSGVVRVVAFEGWEVAAEATMTEGFPASAVTEFAERTHAAMGGMQ